MSHDSSAWNLEEDVLPREREEIAKRRNNAGFCTPSSEGENGKPTAYEPRDIQETVGLALSGGGIRAAAFSLGILQSFYRAGLLRFCDYVSTVSGGSYVGSFLTSLAVHPHSGLNWNAPTEANGVMKEVPGASAAAMPQKNTSSCSMPSAHVAQNGSGPYKAQRRITFEPDERLSQSSFVQRLIYGSSYLEAQIRDRHGRVRHFRRAVQAGL